MRGVSIMWFRRDLRLADNPALLAARDCAEGGYVVPVFVLDPALWKPSGFSPPGLFDRLPERPRRGDGRTARHPPR